MSDYGTPLPFETSIKIYEPWLNAIRRKESANIIFPPRSDRFFRVNHFIKEFETKLPDVIFHHVILQTWLIESADEARVKIDNMTKDASKHHVIFIMDAEWILTNSPQIFGTLQLLSEKNQSNVSFFSLFEVDIRTTEYKHITFNHGILCKNLIYHNLYSKEDIFHFLKYKSRKFKYEAKLTQLNEIGYKCGGYIWLVTEALRYLSDHNELSFNHQEFKLRLNLIWNSFTKEQKAYLEKVVKQGKSSSQDSNYETHFQSIDLVRKTNGRLYLTVPVLKDFILSETENKINVYNQGNRIIMNNIDITNVFSDREHKFLKILTTKNELLNRSDTAKILWGENMDYSEWALDQAIKRLRKKLSNLGINPNLLKTIKGKGYRWKSYGN
jgi:hypothetical protein